MTTHPFYDARDRACSFEHFGHLRWSRKPNKNGNLIVSLRSIASTKVEKIMCLKRPYFSLRAFSLIKATKVVGE